MVYAQPEVPTYSGRLEASEGGVAVLADPMASGVSFLFLLAGLIALETISHALARRCLLGSAGFALRSAGLALRARGGCLLLGLRNRHYALRRRLGLHSHARFQPLQRLQRRHLLLQLQHRLEQVAVLLGSRQHFIRFEHQQSWIAFFEAILNFLPLHRRGNRRPLPVSYTHLRAHETVLDL